MNTVNQSQAISQPSSASLEMPARLAVAAVVPEVISPSSNGANGSEEEAPSENIPAS